MADALATLVVKLEAETARYQSELDKAQKKLSGFAKSSDEQVTKIARAAGAAAVAAAVGFALLAKSAIDSADELNDMAKATGVSVESLSQLKYAAKLSGTDLDGLANGLRKLNSAAFDAAKGVKGPAESFDQLGIKVTDASGKIKSTEELLLETADVFSQYADGAAKAAISQDLFGKSGTALIPFLNQGRAGIEALKKEAAALGLTISQETATAADEFNDSITRLKSSVTGLATQAATALLPTLQAITSQINDTVTSSGAMAKFSDQIATGFKLVVDIGYSVYKTFDNIGGALGALAAAAVAVAHGQFKQAAEIIRLANEDQIKAEKESNEFLRKLWSDTGDSIVATAKKTDEQLKKTFSFGGDKSGLEEVKVTLQKIDSTPTEKFYEELNNLTKTDTERKVTAYHEQQAALEELWAAGTISAEQYNERSSAAIDELLPEFEVTVKKIKEVTEKQTNILTEFQKEAARNTHDIIANTLETGFDNGLQGVAEAFGQMIIKLTAQAVAADLAGKLFGKMGGGTGSGWIGALAGLFGGAKADGGPVSPNSAYLVGERGPEMFVPNSAGKIIPNGAGGGSVTQNNTFILDAPASRQTQQQVTAAAARGLAQANRRGN